MRPECQSELSAKEKIEPPRARLYGQLFADIRVYTYMCVYRLLSSYALCRRKRSGYTTNGMETKEGGGRGIRDKFRGIYYLDK